jgi:hypothetical protein
MPTWNPPAAPPPASYEHYSVTGNWTGGLPSNTTDAIFDGSVSNRNCIINTTGLVCFNFTIQNGYTGTITFTNTLTVRGSITFITSVFFAGPNGILGQSLTNTAVTYNSNNKPFNLPFSVSHNSIVITFVNTWTVTNFTVNSVSGNFIVFTGGIVNVTGNLSGAQNTSASTTQFILTGTGTFSTTLTAWSPSVEINTSGNITIGSIFITSGCVFKYTNALSVTSSVGSLITIGTATLDLQNQALGNLSLQGNGIITLLSNANVLNATLGGGGTGLQLNGVGLRLNVRGNLSMNQASGGLAGSGILTLKGSGTISSVNSSTALTNSGIGVDLELDTTGTYTATSNMSLYTAGKTFTRIDGTINWATFTLFVNASRTFNTDGITFNNVMIAALALTSTINSLFRISGILTINGTNTTFTGTAGWDCNNLISSAAGAFSIILQEGVTYRTRTGVSITGGTFTNRVTMQSSSGSIRAIWTLNFGATQSMIYVNGTRIDSSGEQTVWSFGVSAANVSTSINWNPGVPLRTVAYTFVN